MATVSIVLRKDKLNKNNEAPIHFRIIKNRKINYITSGFMISAADWDEQNKRIKGRGKNEKETASRINAAISKRFFEIQNEVIEIEASKKGITVKAIRETIEGKRPEDFFLFADEVIKSYKLENKIGTHDKTNSIIKKLKKYAPVLSFNDITAKFLYEYEKHLREKEGNGTNTIHTNMKFIRVVFNRAYREELIDYSLNPFLKYKIKTEKTQRLYLSEEELAAFENVDMGDDQKKTLHKDMFIFSAYAGGLRVSDMLQLQWKDFNGINIDFTVKKTGSQLSIKVPNKALAILEKYTPENPNPNSFIFPMLVDGTMNLSPVEIDTAISVATASINRNLKLISKKAEINKNISFHIARHSWATRALRKGMRIEYVSKLLGHSTIKETQVYAKIVNSELDKAMDVFND